MDYKKAILNILLDKYEKSTAYITSRRGGRRIMLKLSSSQFPYYNIEDTDKKDFINSIIDDLAKKDIIGYEWLRFEEGNIIEKIWLNFDNIDEAYKEIGRIPKKKTVKDIACLIDDMQGNIACDWIKLFLDDAKAELNTKKKIPKFLSENISETKDFLKALIHIDAKGDEEILERVFSIQCFGDSKYFERNIRKKLIGLIRHYMIEKELCIEDMTEDDILSQVGIVKAPEQIDFRGNIIGILNGKQVDFSPFCYGTSINSQTVKSIQITSLENVDRILFIENKANYIDYIFNNEHSRDLIVFHGGFYSPVKGLFFEKLYEAIKDQDIECYHWSDIDLGGFMIFNRLKKCIIPSLKPYKMDEISFMSRQDFWQPFDDRYATSLAKLLEDKDYSEFHNLIRLMLNEGAWLEQEAFLVRD